MQNNVPIYSQLESIIRNKIQTGEYKHGQAIPSERKLAESYGINRLTVRAAIANLEKEGLIIKTHGKGNFVSYTKLRQNFRVLGGFSAMLKEHGIEHGYQLISAEVLPAGYRMSQRFQLPKGAPIHRIVRLQLVGGVPVALEGIYIPCVVAPDMHLEETAFSPLHEMLSPGGDSPREMVQVLNTYRVSGEGAQLLQMAEEELVYRVTSQLYNIQGHLTLYAVTLSNPQKTVVVTLLN